MNLTPQDYEAIVRECPSVLSAAPEVRARTQVVYGNRNWHILVAAVSTEELPLQSSSLPVWALFSAIIRHGEHRGWTRSKPCVTSKGKIADMPWQSPDKWIDLRDRTSDSSDWLKMVFVHLGMTKNSYATMVKI